MVSPVTQTPATSAKNSHLGAAKAAKNDEFYTQWVDIQREMLDLVDRFVVLSDWARKVLIANGAPPAKIALNRLGVRFPAAQTPTRHSRSPLTVAYIGRFDPVKGVTDFARAISTIPRSAPMRCGSIKEQPQTASSDFAKPRRSSG